MRQEKKFILKNVLTADSIDSRGSFGFGMEDNKVICDDCLSPLFYVAKTWGIVEETWDYNVVGFRGKQNLALRELGLALFCSECGAFNDDFDTWVYPDEKVVCTWKDDGLDYAEKEVIQAAINSYNRTGEVKGFYESSEIKYLREKVREYEEKNNIKTVKKNGKRNKGNKKTVR